MPDLSDVSVTVTGGLGFIGSNLTLTLVEQGADVTVIDLPKSDGGPDTTTIGPVRGDVEVIRADVRDTAAIKPAISQADVVFHFASRISRLDSVKHPEPDTTVTCLGTLSVLEAAAAATAPPRVVFASSQSAVGRFDGEVFDGRARSQGELVDVYGANKRAAEGYCRAYYRSRGVPTVVVRLTNVYGPRGSLDTTAVDIFVRAALNDDPLTVFEPGTQRRDLIYVGDVVDALVELSVVDGVVGDRFALGTGRSHEVKAVAETITDVAASGEVVLGPWPDSWNALRLGNLRADPSRLREATDWTPTTSLRAGLERTVRYYTAR
jgi:UDP-glucose 4-epimerase